MGTRVKKGGVREEYDPPSTLSHQPHFSKLMRRKWLSSTEALDGIVGTLGAQALALRRMQDEPYQVRCWGGAGWGRGDTLKAGSGFLGVR